MKSYPECIDWLVPEQEWDAFIVFISREFGDYDGCLGRHVENAMNEYAGRDGCLENVERKLREIRGPRKDEKNSTSGNPCSVEGIDALANDSKRRIQVRVDPSTKSAFKERAADADDPFGVELARALRQYRTNPRDARLESLVSSIESIGIFDTDGDSDGKTDTDTDTTVEDTIDDEAASSAECSQPTTPIDRDTIDVEDGNGNTDSDDGNSDLSAVDQKVEAIVDALPETHQFHDSLFDSTIRSIVDDDSEDTIDTYRDQVVDVLDIAIHPVNPDMWIPREDADELNDLSKVELTTRKIAYSLPTAEFTDDQLVEAIKEQPNTNSKPTIDKYRERVVDHVDVVRDPEDPDNWLDRYVAIDIADQIGLALDPKTGEWIDQSAVDDIESGAPWETRVPVEHLSRDDRVRRIVLEAGLRAAKNDNGEASIPLSHDEEFDVLDGILDGAVSSATVREDIKNVVDGEAFTSGKSLAKKRRLLKVELEKLKETDPDLIAEIIDYRDAPVHGTHCTDDTDTAVEDTIDVEDADTIDSDDVEDTIDAELEALESATPTADGGTHQPVVHRSRPIRVKIDAD